VRGAPHPRQIAIGAWICFLFALTACELVIKTSDLEGGCPGGLPGPSLVKVESGSGPYCIDSTEVTNGQYQAFVDARGSVVPPIMAEGCSGVTSLLPDMPGPGPGAEDFPKGRVSWCQAQAYCAWAGKRLCGKVGGGPIVDSLLNNARFAQWFNACSKGGTQSFAYGDVYKPNVCVDKTPPIPVGTSRGCEGGFPGIFDMSGNLWEFVDNCNGPGAANACTACGGAFDSVNEFSCTNCRTWGRTAFATDIGFRCCKDL
jgi:sulfatase modifying factor 1